LPETYPGMTQESRQAAQQFLTDPDPRLRRAGIQLLRGKFGATSEFLDHFERLALSDFDEGVRIASLGALIDYYSGTQNQRIGKLLAEMVRNESLSLLFRDIAYQGLFRVHRLPIDDWPEVKRATGRFNFPEDVNWNLVDVLLVYLEGIFHRERREWGQAVGCLQKLVGKKEENNRRERRERGDGAEKTIHEAKQSAEASPLPSVSSAFSAVNNSSFGSADGGLNGYLARHQLALVYYQQGRWEEAEAAWKLALADRPGYFDALKGLGEMYLKQRRWAELEQVVEHLEEEKTASHGLHGEHGYEGQIIKARGMLARKEFEKARTVLEPMAAALPGAVYPRVILSHAYLQEGRDLPAAERMLREIVELDPSQAETWRNLAVLLRQQGRLEEAVEVCRTGWRHCLVYPTLPLLLGITFDRSSKLRRRGDVLPEASGIAF